MITTLSDRANLAAVTARARLERLTREPELGALAPVDVHRVIAAASVVTIVLGVVGLVASHMGLLG